MTGNPELDMNSENPSSSCEPYETEEMGTQKISVSNQTNGLQYTNNKSDNFAVDMERFSHLTDKDILPNSRITLQRSLSRKGSHRGGEKKTNSSSGNERDSSVLSTPSPRAALAGASTPEKPMAGTIGATDHAIPSQVHHQITIMTGNINTATATATATAESRFGIKRSSFRRSSPSWVLDPRRILFLFATLSSMGTILLIYFTLSMGKLSRDANALDWQR